MEKEVKMKIQDNKLIVKCPEGYEVDKENSTFECIKFKPIITKRWRDGNPHVNGYCVKDNHISREYINLDWKDKNLDVFATEKQAKSALAMAQISQIMANDERFGGVVTDEEWESITFKCVISRSKCGVMKLCPATSVYYFLAFHTEEQCNLFLAENKDLVKDYLMID